MAEVETKLQKLNNGNATCMGGVIGTSIKSEGVSGDGLEIL